MKSYTCWALLGLCLLSCQPDSIPPTAEVAVIDPKKQTAVPTEESIEPVAPIVNSDITITNTSRNGIGIHVYLNGKDPSDLLYCELAAGNSFTISLKEGDHTLYPFTNMYQFGKGRSISVVDQDPMQISLFAGP